jgi:HK97 family phage major capsid protein
MPSAKLIEKRKEFEAKQLKLHTVLEEAGSELDMAKVKSLGEGDSKAKVDSIRKMNKELEDIGKEVDALAELDSISSFDLAREHAVKGLEGAPPQPMGRKAENREEKSIGQMFTESPEFKAFRPGTRQSLPVTLDIPLKTTMTTTAGWAPQSLRTGKVVDYATRPIQIIDLIPAGRTTNAAIVYMEETGFTNTAAEHVESTGAMVEATLALTQRSVTVQEIGVWLPVTRQQLEDVEGITSYIDNRLSFMLRQRLDSQIIVGTGLTCFLAGLLANAGRQTFVLAGDQLDAIYDAARRVRVTGRANPNAVIVHPNDWQPIRLKRSNDGLYILGNPNEPLSRIWGMQVVESDAITEGSTLVGDFASQCELVEKRGIVLEVTDSHASLFINNVDCVKATVRVALVNYRPSAFCEISGM